MGTWLAKPVDSRWATESQRASDSTGGLMSKIQLPHQASACRRLTATIAGLAAVALLVLAPAAFAEINVVRVFSGSGVNEVQFPQDLATDSSGNVYVTDAGSERVVKFTADGRFLRKWGTRGSGNGQFDDPVGIATDSSGNVYVTEASNHRVQKFTSTGSFIRKWGTRGSGNGQFRLPWGIATDRSGNVYVADLNNNRIQQFTANGTFLRKWGTQGSANGRFDSPQAVDTDPGGKVYVADTGNARVQKFTPNGGFLLKWGTPGYGKGQFQYPDGIATNADGQVYVTDSSRGDLQKFSSTGQRLPASYNFLYESGVSPSGAIGVGPQGNLYVPASDFRGPAAIWQLVDGPPWVDVSAQDGYLFVSAVRGGSDNIQITRPTSGTLRVKNAPSGPYAGAAIHAGPGCTKAGTYTVNCNATGVTRISLDANTGADQVINNTRLPSRLFGGYGADTLIGGSSDDYIFGWKGSDVMKGMNGNDDLRAWDDGSDRTINCDGGTTPGTADQADLDQLPDDSSVSGCEAITRH
jgi:sugar lactone lactonase YvrE